jgi:ABC-2 type transport system permease protein
VIVEQARALVWLRTVLGWRRIAQERQWGRLVLSLISIAMALLVSGSIALAIFGAAGDLQSAPAQVVARGGAAAIFATWLAAVLAARVWFALLPRAQSAALFDPRRFLVFAVPARLVSALNFAAQLLDPAWLFFWPILAAMAVAGARIPGMPGTFALLAAEALCIWAVAGVLHLVAALGAALDSRASVRRVVSVVFLLAAFAFFQLGLSSSGRRGAAGLLAGNTWKFVAYTPPGWAASAALDLSRGHLARASVPAVLLLLLGLAAAVLAHFLSKREARRPVEAGPLPARAGRGNGWALPGLPDTLAALFEKEAKTVLRVGWVQLIVISVGFLVLRSFVFRDAGAVIGRQPLLFAAVYAHLGVIELTTNAFGRDLGGARAWFLWPVRPRAIFAAKNAVAYGFSLLIFVALVLVAVATGPVHADQIVIGFLAHLALFPLLATIGNVASVLWPVPVRGMRLGRVRGSGPVGARMFALLALSAAGWAPYALAAVFGLPTTAAYLGELVAMAVAYGGLIAFAAHLFESRRESLVSALSRDE